MRNYLSEYTKNIENELKKKKTFTKEEVKKFYEKILFFQHERLIHLLVTLFYSLFAIIFLCLGMISFYFLIIFGILIIFVLFYIVHYFFLENSVQYLYKLYDEMLERSV